MRKPELDDEEDFLDETMNNIPSPDEEARRSTVDLESEFLVVPPLQNDLIK